MSYFAYDEFNDEPTAVSPFGCCECGDPSCDGDAKWLAKATADIAEQLADSVPGLDSPMLKLIKERNEARRLCALLAGSYPDLALCLKSDKALTNANAEMHEALMTYCKTKKHWDKRSYEIGGQQ